MAATCVQWVVQTRIEYPEEEGKAPLIDEMFYKEERMARHDFLTVASGTDRADGRNCSIGVGQAGRIVYHRLFKRTTVITEEEPIDEWRA